MFCNTKSWLSSIVSIVLVSLLNLLEGHTVRRCYDVSAVSCLPHPPGKGTLPSGHQPAMSSLVPGVPYRTVEMELQRLVTAVRL